MAPMETGAVSNSPLPPSTLILTTVSASGQLIAQRRYSVPLSSLASSSRAVAINRDGDIVVAIEGILTGSSSTQPLMWTNADTGTKKYCALNDASALILFSPNDLELRKQQVFDHAHVRALRRDGDSLYAAIGIETNCSLSETLRLAELDLRLELKSIYQSDYVNSLDVKDFWITQDKFVLVGQLRRFLPSVLVRQSRGFDSLAHSLLGDDIWEMGDERRSAFVLIIRKDGALVADRVLSDDTHRVLASIVSVDTDHFVAGRSAFGDLGWLIGFKLGKRAEERNQ